MAVWGVSHGPEREGLICNLTHGRSDRRQKPVQGGKMRFDDII